MKKGIILTAIILSCTYAYANPGFNPSAINNIQTFQGLHAHELDSIRQQRFRYEEINDAKDLKEQKEKINRRDKTEVLNDSRGAQTYTPSPTKEVKFVEENGEIKIEGK